jgi:hypothetical protein
VIVAALREGRPDLPLPTAQLEAEAILLRIVLLPDEKARMHGL